MRSSGHWPFIGLITGYIDCCRDEVDWNNIWYVAEKAFMICICMLFVFLDVYLTVIVNLKSTGPPCMGSRVCCVCVDICDYNVLCKDEN